MNVQSGTEWFDHLFARCVEEQLLPEQVALPDHPELVESLRKGLEQHRASAVVGYEEASPARGVPNRYVELERVDAGGMGVVYKARDLELDRHVAYKVMSESFARQVGRALAEERFYHEARLTSRLKHPGIVPVHGLVIDSNGMPAYAMDLIDGEPLSMAIDRFHRCDWRVSRIENWHLDLHVLLRHLVAACNIIHHAHTANEETAIIHGDLKPSNVMVGRGSHATWVIDWGIARERHRSDAPSEERDRLTTPGFSGPSALRGEPATEASDVYSLGGILGCILTPPADARIKGRPAPKALAAIRDKAMHPARERRYESAGALAADLLRYLEDAAVSVYPDPMWKRVHRWWRHRPVLATSLASTVLCLLVLIAAGAVVWSLVTRNNERRRSDAERLALEQRQGKKNQALIAFQRAGMRQLGLSGRAEIQSSLNEAIRLLEGLREEGIGDWYVHYLLFHCYTNAGAVEMNPAAQGKGKPRQPPPFARALEWFDKAERVRQDLEQATSANAEQDELLAQYWQWRGTALMGLGRHTEALRAYDQGLVIAPNDMPSRLGRTAALRGAEKEQARAPWSRAPSADHSKAISHAAYLAESQGVSAAAVYNAACAFALAAADQPTGPERDRLAGRAVGYLQRIAKDGYFRVAGKRHELQADQDLKSLHPRADFRDLLKQIDAP